MGETIAIIPARGDGDIPRKNIKLLNGIPLIAHSILAAKNASLIDDVYVSTDDSEIAETALKYGAQVIEYPNKTTSDIAFPEGPLLHAQEHFENTSRKVERLVLLQCTTPLIFSEDLDGAIELMEQDNADCVFAASASNSFIWEANGDEGATIVNHLPDARQMGKKLPGQFIESGAFYILKAEGFKKANYRFFGRIKIFETPPERSVEITEPLDFVICEAICSERSRQNRLMSLPDMIELIVFDFDGVFTDNSVIVDETGKESVICSRSDSLGLALLRKEVDLPMLILSTETNQVTRRRAEKLGLEVAHGIADKGKALQKLMLERKINPSNVVFVGNDQNDLACLEMVGCPVVVSDAHVSVKNIAKVVLEHEGGKGAIRELCDLLISKFIE